MTLHRHLVARRGLAALVCAAALLLRLLVPTGWMLGNNHGRPVVELCAGVIPTLAGTAPLGDPAVMPGMAMPGDPADHHDHQPHGKAEAPCAFGGLAGAWLGAADPVQLALLLLFILAAGLCPRPCAAVRRAPRLRPPGRAPPGIVAPS